MVRSIACLLTAAGLFGYSGASAQEIAVSQEYLELANGTPANTFLNTEFAPVQVNSSSGIAQIWVHNLDSQNNVQIQSVQLSGTGAGHFEIEGPFGMTASLDAPTLFYIRYKPTAANTHNATVTINSNDADEAAYSFGIRGSSYVGFPFARVDLRTNVTVKKVKLHKKTNTLKVKGSVTIANGSHGLALEEGILYIYATNGLPFADPNQPISVRSIKPIKKRNVEKEGSYQRKFKFSTQVPNVKGRIVAVSVPILPASEDADYSNNQDNWVFLPLDL